MMFFLLQIALLLVPEVVHCLNQDGLSLLALKSAIETDPTRILDSWSESDPTPCHWHGVACTRNRVTDLLLTNKRLTGYIPSELGHVDSLKRLNLSNNNFSMPIPAHLFNAAALISLDLSNNSLVGPIPDQIRSLKALNYLDLSSNFLNGSFPESIAELPSLAGNMNLSYKKKSRWRSKPAMSAAPTSSSTTQISGSTRCVLRREMREGREGVVGVRSGPGKKIVLGTDS